MIIDIDKKITWTTLASGSTFLKSIFPCNSHTEVRLRPIDRDYSNSRLLFSALSFVNNGESLLRPGNSYSTIEYRQMLADMFLYFPTRMESERDMRQFVAAMLVGCGLYEYYRWECKPGDIIIRFQNNKNVSMFSQPERQIVDQLYEHAMEVGGGVRLLELTLSLLGSARLEI